MVPTARMVASVTCGQEVLADPDDRSLRHLHDRGEPGSPTEVEVQHGVGAREGPLAAAALGGEEREELDELLVGVGDRRPDLAATVGVQQQHAVVAGDLYVLDVRQVHERLQPAQTEQAVEDGGGQRLLVVEVHQARAVQCVRTGVVLEQAPDDRPPELAPVLLVDAGARRSCSASFCEARCRNVRTSAQSTARAS